ncbi:hypothetical protein XM53_00945 [Roseovarius atlanticus]|uniref:Uncharacterized protein n=2 Tax=Roseovarius atlanticus TaxID=1641875 RepID=A0A0T5NZM3_9RHOB|nr:hypothetical protein XM53_00945 [Roseovarius atlanticus]
MFDSHIDVLRHIERKSDEAIMQSVTKSLPNILDKYRQDHDEDVPYKTTAGFIKSFGKKKRKRPAPKIPLIDLVDTKDILSRMTVSEKIVLGLNLIFRPSAY